MKVTNSDVYLCAEPLKKLMGEKFPVKTSYGLAKLGSKINGQIKIIEDVRLGLVKKYGKESEKGRFNVNAECEGWADFLKEFNDLMAEEVDIDVEKVKIAERVVQTCDKCKHNMDAVFLVEPNTLMSLAPFIEVV